MKTGILIGYFEPLHLGHLADINHATGQTDTLHVVILPKDGDSLLNQLYKTKPELCKWHVVFLTLLKCIPLRV